MSPEHPGTATPPPVLPGGAFLRTSVLMFGGLAGVAAAFTLLFLVMSALSRIGGSCADGGPYEVVHRCPQGATPAIVIVLFGGMVSFAVYGLSRFPAGPRLALLAFPATLLVMGYSFVRDGLHPAGGARVSGSSLAIGIPFALVGLALLLPLAKPTNLRSIFWNDGRVPARLFRKWANSSRRSARNADHDRPDAATWSGLGCARDEPERGFTAAEPRWCSPHACRSGCGWSSPSGGHA